MPLRATLGCQLNPTYVDCPCFEAIKSLTCLPPATVEALPDTIEYKMYGIHIERPKVGGAEYFFCSDANGNTQPRIVTYHGRPQTYRLNPANDLNRFDRATIDSLIVMKHHFLLRPSPESQQGYPFSRAAVYTNRENALLTYRDKTYTAIFQKAWRFPSRDDCWNLYFTKPVFESYIETQDDSVSDLMEVVQMCTPRVFGIYSQDSWNVSGSQS